MVNCLISIHRFPKTPINHSGYHPVILLVAPAAAQIAPLMLNARCTKIPVTIVWELRPVWMVTSFTWREMNGTSSQRLVSNRVSQGT